MNALLALYPGDAVAAFALKALLQATVVAAVSLTIARAAGRRSPVPAVCGEPVRGCLHP
jgi:hypothetical protein